ncbi:MAG: hypothetical protein O3A46_16935, partial [Candidatus Poribacteria bacterium]|nr:hypothetical protein [Candidatus Poribacteria bacterium]
WRVVAVSTEDGKLTAKMPHRIITLTPESDTVFYEGDDGATWTFAEDGSTLTVANETAQRFDYAAPTATQLAEYAGRYVCDELQTICEIVVEDARLLWRNQRADDRKLTHSSGDCFLLEGGHSRLEFTRDGNNIGAFHYSDGRVRRLRFDHTTND